MFENLLASYPKRLDVWYVYVDQVITSKDYDSARKIFDRMVRIKVSTKNKRQIFKKYIEFSKTHGSPVECAKINTEMSKSLSIDNIME
ncbi:hypothetical protein A3Q56_08176 [Intoshia linei]|uniref:Suppressor of forked domain-containing protein n=1 Tax=Intoshia linei TaxID=1819745 RepID=A0A177AQN6_9BILA|nr:hypothetical protein A3Q56_08176 [Intoshia linei]